MALDLIILPAVTALGQGGHQVSLLALVTVKRLWTTGKKNAISGKLTCFLDQPRSLKPHYHITSVKTSHSWSERHQGFPNCWMVHMLSALRSFNNWYNCSFSEHDAGATRARALRCFPSLNQIDQTQVGTNFDLLKMRKNLKLIFGSWNRHIWSVFGVNFDN